MKHFFIHIECLSYLLVVMSLNQSCIATALQMSTILPGFRASQMDYSDGNGVFLLSNNSIFALGFKPTDTSSLFRLVIIHHASNTVVWTANRVFPVANSDKFVFHNNGSVSLHSGEKAIWKPDTGGKPVSAIKLLDSGNLVFFGSDNTTIVWESFRYPTNTLLPNQNFSQGMQLSNDPDSNADNLTFLLEAKAGDIILTSSYKTSQTYWSLRKDSRKIINKNDGMISSAVIESNSWKFYDQSETLLWQFVFSSNPEVRNSTWIAVLGNDGVLGFYGLRNGPSKVLSAVRVPHDPCRTPEPCQKYFACSGSKCQCPSGLVSRSCNIGINASCGDPNEQFDLVSAGDGLGYFGLLFAQASMKTNLTVCQASCASNCTCLGLFFHNKSQSCFLFDWIGSFILDPSSEYSVYVKVQKNRSIKEDGIVQGYKMRLPIIITAVFLAFFIVVMICGGYMHCVKKDELESIDSFEDDIIYGTLSRMPVRYSYKSLEEATNNFSLKVGQGGFGSVYQGKLPDGTLLAVKKLEGFSQGRKQFQAEVSTIGSIHHHHVVRLKGFSAEGTQWLLAYEFMAKGSLDKWIFNRSKGTDDVLDWPTRFSIALGTAKGLAYLHEDCEVKIVHCDIKPENVLLDENFVAKVSDFGLAKLMMRDQSHVFTTLRGTRGYLAPEWIMNCAISEKSDVYSYGMVLLEIIGGRKNYDPQFSSEKFHFSAFAYKMMEEGNFSEILDPNLAYEPNDESVKIAIKVALWCIQEDKAMRPSMTVVVQMLEGICHVPYPPKPLTCTGISPRTMTRNSSSPSAVQLSGPR